MLPGESSDMLALREAYSNPRRQLQKGVKRNLHNSRYTVTPGYKFLRRNKASTLTARQALQLLICFTDRIPLDAACSMADVETSRRSLYEQEPGLHTRFQDSWMWYLRIRFKEHPCRPR